MLRLLGHDLPNLAGGAILDPVTEFTRLLRFGSEQVYAREVRELADSVGDTRVVRLVDRGVAALSRRHFLRDAIHRLAPGRQDRTMDLLPWGHGPVPPSA
jgi:hypothetical protein